MRGRRGCEIEGVVVVYMRVFSTGSACFGVSELSTLATWACARRSRGPKQAWLVSR